MCISFVIILFGFIYFLETYSASTNMGGFKAGLYVHNSYEKHQHFYGKRIKCSDYLLAADPLHSSIYKEGKDTLHLGDYVYFKVVLFNGYGRPMITGGDHLRARLYNDSIGAYTPGKILDHENGTYTFIFQALWTGLARLEAELLYTKEILATAIRLRKMNRFPDVFAKFSYMNRTEKTKCSPDYNFAASYSNSSKVCNFSYWDLSLPWYCAMPEHNMSCKNWVSVLRGWEHFIKGINKCEKNLSMKRKYTRIPSNITVRILNKSDEDKNTITIVEPDNPCSSYNFTKLWFMETPTGYFYNNTWNLLHCKGTTVFDGECLRNKTILFWGDSTLKQWFEYFKAQLGVKSRFSCKMMVNITIRWQQNTMCFYHKYNLTTYYMGHNLPVTAISRNKLYYWLKTNNFEQIINNRKSDDFLLVIHLYTHIQQYSFEFFANHFYAIRKILKRSFEMDIKIQVFIKLPHTYRRYKDQDWILRQSDYVGFIYTDILRTIFKGLYNRVIVLDQKDATIATRNVDIHPSDSIVQGMVLQLMSYACRSN